MIDHRAKRSTASLKRWRLLGWGLIMGLIALPPIAMRFTDEVKWGQKDFAFAVVMLLGVGLAFEMAVRASGSSAYRGGVAVALAASLLLLWVNAAVDIVDNEDSDVNMLFNLVPAAALVGAIAARFRAPGMVIAMTATTTVQVIVGFIAQCFGHFTWVVTTGWAGLWILAEWMFRRA